MKGKALGRKLLSEVACIVTPETILTPNDFPSLGAVEQRLLAFQSHYESIARPFEWKFTRADLAKLLAKASASAALAA